MKLNVLIRKLCTHPRRCIRGLRRRFVPLGKCIQPAQNEADENRILFEKLPYILQCSIYRKFSYAQFAKFDECSTSSHSFRSFPNDKFPLAVNYCDLRYDGAYCTGPTRCFDFGWRDMTQVQNLVLEVDVLDITNLQTPVMFSILKKTIGKVNKIIYQYYSPYYLQIVKKYQPKEVVIKVDWGHPKLQEESYFDYKGVWDVTITNGGKINPPENIFKFKAERSVTVHNSELTHNQLFRRIADWRDGRWSFDYQIDIHCNAFLISNFIQMMRVYETRTTDVGREWTVVRNDATLFVQEHAGCHFSFHTVTE